MASQTPGAARGEGLGSSMTHQMAAGDAQSSLPRFGAVPQRQAQQTAQPAPIGGLSPRDIPPPYSSDYAQAAYGQTQQYRSPMPPSVASSPNLPPFVSQKISSDPYYGLPYPAEQANGNLLPQPRQQNYAIASAPAPMEPVQPRPASSNSSADSAGGGTNWSAMYANAMGSTEQLHQLSEQAAHSQPPQANQTIHTLPHPHQQQQHQPHPHSLSHQPRNLSSHPSYSYPTPTSDVRHPEMYHVAAASM